MLVFNKKLVWEIVWFDLNKFNKYTLELKKENFEKFFLINKFRFFNVLSHFLNVEEGVL